MGPCGSAPVGEVLSFRPSRGTVFEAARWVILTLIPLQVFSLQPPSKELWRAGIANSGRVGGLAETCVITWSPPTTKATLAVSLLISISKDDSPSTLLVFFLFGWLWFLVQESMADQVSRYIYYSREVVNNGSRKRRKKHRGKHLAKPIYLCTLIQMPLKPKGHAREVWLHLGFLYQ